MSHPSNPYGSDPVEPQVRRFVREVTQAFAAHGLDGSDLARVRAAAEAVRTPWRQGGPEMASSTETMVETAGGPVRIRIHRPEGAPQIAPVLVYMHGGGWVLFSIDTHDRLMREYAARAGVAVVGVDYALSPEARFPTALDQISAVVDWISASGASFGLDAERIALGGDSAGGNLALAAALDLRDRGGARALKALLLNYGAFVPGVSEEAARLYGGEDFMLGAEEMEDFWRDYLRSEEDRRDPRAAPGLAKLHGLPPAHLTIPQCDILAEQSHALAARLREAGVEVDEALYRGATHSFLEAVSISPLAEQAIEAAAQWLKAKLRP